MRQTSKHLRLVQADSFMNLAIDKLAGLVLGLLASVGISGCSGSSSNSSSAQSSLVGTLGAQLQAQLEKQGMSSTVAAAVANSATNSASQSSSSSLMKRFIHILDSSNSGTLLQIGFCFGRGGGTCTSRCWGLR